MKKLLRLTINCVVMLFSVSAFAQTDAENIANAKSALTLNHNCEDAIHYLNLVNPDSRQTADYYLCMARTQDCKKNNEQALYYYNKYLGLKPGTDSVMKRVAELKDVNQKAKGDNESAKAKNIYQTASKNKKRRHYLLTDNYYTSGIGYGMGLSGTKSPYGSAIILNGGDGFVLMHSKAVLDINSTTCFLTSPNETWYNNAVQAPAGTGGLGNGLAEIITMGFNPALINNKNLALTAGVLAGINIYLLNGNIDYSNYTIRDKFSFCYGIKSNLYLGEHVMFFAHLIFTTANSVDVTNDITTFSVPTNFNMLQIGVSYKFDSWW